MKQNKNSGAIKLITKCGKKLTIDKNGKVWDGMSLVDNMHMSVELLHYLKPGARISYNDDIVEIAEITQQFSEERQQKLGRHEKKTELRDDKLLGWVLTAFPSLRVGLAEMQNSTVTEWLGQLPIPVLQEMFESAPPEVQVLLIPALVALGCMVAGTQIVGHAINKARYGIKKMQLMNHFANKGCIRIEKGMDEYNQQRKHNKAGQAFRNTKENMCGAKCPKSC